MTLIGEVSKEEFIANFPLDFGRGIRGEHVAHRRKIAGIVICHILPENLGCACSIFWVKIDGQKIYTKATDDPLNIEEDIYCSCGMHGWIRNGRWEHAHDSLL